MDAEMIGAGVTAVAQNALSKNQMEEKVGANEESNTHPTKKARLQWSQWQLIDSLLPTGGFAHSLGLEAAIQTQIVNSHQSLHKFIIHVLENTGSLLLPFVHGTTLSPNLEVWHKNDMVLNAMLTNEIARKASTAQGSALLRMGATIFTEFPSLKAMRDASLGSPVCFHHAPIFGLIYGILGFDPGTAQRAYLFMALRDIISAATRLNVVGPMGAAVLQHQIAASVAEEILNRWKDRDVEDACQTSPLLDTVQGCHDYLFSRMFCS